MASCEARIRDKLKGRNVYVLEGSWNSVISVRIKKLMSSPRVAGSVQRKGWEDLRIEIRQLQNYRKFFQKQQQLCFCLQLKISKETLRLEYCFNSLFGAQNYFQIEGKLKYFSKVSKQQSKVKMSGFFEVCRV